MDGDSGSIPNDNDITTNEGRNDVDSGRKWARQGRQAATIIGNGNIPCSLLTFGAIGYDDIEDIIVWTPVRIMGVKMQAIWGQAKTWQDINLVCSMPI